MAELTKWGKSEIRLEGSFDYVDLSLVDALNISRQVYAVAKVGHTVYVQVRILFPAIQK